MQSLWSEINLIRLSKWHMFVYVGVQEVDDKNSLTNPSASPMKQLAFNRSPKQAISVREINKPRPSRSTSIDGTPYFSGTYSRSTGAPPPLPLGEWKKNNRSSTLSIFHSQRTPFSCFPFVFLLSPGFWYVGFGTNRIGSLVFFWKKHSVKHWLEQWGPCLLSARWWHTS